MNNNDEIDDYGCGLCGERVLFDEVNWITSSFGLCDKCRSALTNDEVMELVEAEDTDDFVRIASVLQEAVNAGDARED